LENPQPQRRLAPLVAVVVIIVVVIGASIFVSGVRFGAPGETSGPSTETSTTSSTSSASPSGATGTNTATSVIATTSQGTSNGDWLTDDPAFIGNSSTIDYPPDYGALANFTLGLINADRANAGIAPVVLSPEPSGQQHADSMSYYGYFSHWDSQGYKPYMRYTLLGGAGGVAENAAVASCTNVLWQRELPCSLQTVENSVNDSEWQMMNNDTVCCNNGHRENILSAEHNRVSIGVAYNSTAEVAYLVEDFEDSYIANSSLSLAGDVVTFQGTTQQDLTGWNGGASGAEISLYYDPAPANIPTSELLPDSACDQYSELAEPPSCQYQGAYGEGTAVTTVLAPCPLGYSCGSGNFTYAQTWQQQASGSFEISFSIGQFEAAYGPGVYTVYLWPAGDSTEPITSLSVFVTG